MSRHDKLLQLIEIFQPKTIVEIGTWNGQNAIQMLKAASKYHQNPMYIGYDLFEDATDETDATEYNVKAHIPMEVVKSEIERACPNAEVALVRGNTRQTLTSVTADFVFIDGGHSIETIQHDYEAVKHSNVIVFDDFYRPDENGNVPDISKYGCNKVLENIPHAVIETDDVVRLVKNGPQHGKNGLGVVFGQ